VYLVTVWVGKWVNGKSLADGLHMPHQATEDKTRLRRCRVGLTVKIKGRRVMYFILGRMVLSMVLLDGCKSRKLNVLAVKMIDK
jgi:hypothetical protein